MLIPKEITKQGIPVYAEVKCSYPACGGNASVEHGQFHFCRKHADLVGFILWIVPFIKTSGPNESEKSDSKIIVPKVEEDA